VKEQGSKIIAPSMQDVDMNRNLIVERTSGRVRHPPIIILYACEVPSLAMPHIYVLYLGCTSRYTHGEKLRCKIYDLTQSIPKSLFYV